MMGLCDVAALADQTGNGADSRGTISTLGGETPHFGVPLSPHCSPVVVGLLGTEITSNDGENQSISDSTPLAAVFDPQGGIKNAASYHTPNRLGGAA